MGIGDVYSVESVPGCYYVDVGAYGTAGYGSIYMYDTERPAIVDTGLGTNYERILEGLDEIGIAPDELESILLTHVHLDHAGGVGPLTDETDADVYVHASGARFLTDPGPLWEGTKAAVGDAIRYYTEPKPIPQERIVPVEGGDSIDIGGPTLDVHRAPGHAFHQVVFHDTQSDAVFSGDAAGIYVPAIDAVVETSPPPGFDLEQVVADARMIGDLDPETICYAHFSPSPTNGRIDEYVGVITDWVEEVQRKREELDDDAVVEHFVERSGMADVWGDLKADTEVAMNVRGVMHYLDEADE